MSDAIIELSHIKNYLGDQWVHTDVNLTVNRGEILAIVGGSGSGKSTLLRTMLLLQTPTAGSVRIFGEIMTADNSALNNLRQRFGVLFQQSALFSSLTLLENVAFPLQEHTSLSQQTIEELALLKILAAGLEINDAAKYPAELSGGMQKRAAIARAIALDPELLFLDEPTSGLDPQSAAAFDELVLNLQKTLGLTIVMVTHDMDTLWQVTNRVAFLGEGRVIAAAPIEELVAIKQPLIQDYFNGPRGRMMEKFYTENNDHPEEH